MDMLDFDPGKGVEIAGEIGHAEQGEAGAPGVRTYRLLKPTM
jgi:hypothetical protein